MFDSKVYFIRLPEVLARCGLGRTKLYELVKTDDFPGPVRIGRANLWDSQEIDLWRERRLAERDA
jgi:prophage regulatory protein